MNRDLHREAVAVLSLTGDLTRRRFCRRAAERPEDSGSTGRPDGQCVVLSPFCDTGVARPAAHSQQRRYGHGE